jgi:hypothetical protein
MVRSAAKPRVSNREIRVLEIFILRDGRDAASSG